MDIFIQKKLFHGSQRYEFIDEKRIKSTRINYRGIQEEVFNLFDLEPNFDRYLQRPYKHLAIALMFLAPALPFIYDAMLRKSTEPLIAAAIFIIPVIICLILYFSKTINLIVFRNRYNGAPAILLWPDKPTESEVNDFVIGLSDRIENIKINPNSTPHQKLELYKDSISFLFTEGVLTEDEALNIFERTKERILNSNNKAELFSIDSTNR